VFANQTLDDDYGNYVVFKPLRFCWCQYVF